MGKQTATEPRVFSVRRMNCRLNLMQVIIHFQAEIQGQANQIFDEET